MDYKDKIAQIQDKLNELQRKQNDSTREIEEIQVELRQLLRSINVDTKSTEELSTTSSASLEESKIEESALILPPPIPRKTTVAASHDSLIETPITEKRAKSSTTALPPPLAPKTAKVPHHTPQFGKKEKSTNFEKIVGENLINKVGILILVIGVGIGTKYSFEHDLISPLMRIILGYLLGCGLLFVGLKLRSKYENYSAVLVSGALTIFYFISYFAYAFYELLPLPIAFALMFCFTIFAVVAALSYNKQVIAIIGLVGAYAVPFFLSNNSGEVLILFSYMTIINVGILILAIKKYWKPLYYIAFGISWLIFATWAVTAVFDGMEDNFAIAALFSSVFFLLFYSVFIFYKLIKEEKFNVGDIALVLLNSFVYYALGYFIVSSQSWGAEYIGLFTLLNAMVHFIFSLLVYRKSLADRNIFYLISGLVLVFIAITIPIQLSGGWITLSWALLATLLFWIGRTKDVRFYEILSYPLMLLSFFAFLLSPYGNSSVLLEQMDRIPFFNIGLLISLLIIAAFAYINYLNYNKAYQRVEFHNRNLTQITHIAIPATFLLIVFISFAREINYLFEYKLLSYPFSSDQEKSDAIINYVVYNRKNLKLFNKIWLINYCLLFSSALSFINLKFIKSAVLNKTNLVLNIFASFIFLTVGLYLLKELRDIFLLREQMELYNLGSANISIRYISIGFFLLTLYAAYQCFAKIEKTEKRASIIFELALHTTVLILVSSELMYWLNIANLESSYSISLTVIWGLYSLFLVAFGIWKKKKHLRIGAIALFGVTLYKLFFYDIGHFNTLSKTIVFIALGLLLLLISFLYNKYKNIIFNDENEETK